MKFFYAILLLSFGTSLLKASDLCEIENNNIIQRIELGDETPEYFFKPIMPQDQNDQRDEIGFILEGHGNVLMDFKTGKIKKIPGPFDAVPSIDAKIITVPSNEENNYYFTIYSRDDLSEPLYKETGDKGGLRGLYQSVGLVNNTGKTITYRVLTDRMTTNFPTDDEVKKTEELPLGSDIEYKDYTFNIAGNTLALPAGTVVMGERKKLCPNVNTPLKLPMLSKNGKLLAAYNHTTGTTNIFDIRIDKDGKSSCILKKDLGFASTKVEFSPDSDKIIFASDGLSSTSSKVTFYRQPRLKSMNMNVYVLDLKTNDMTKVSNQVNGNAYYPSFSKDNTVTYLSQTGDDNKIEYSFVRSKLPEKSLDLKNTNPEFFQFNACEYTKEDLSLMAIGKLWYNVCTKFDRGANVQGASFLALSLDPEKCQALVKTYWRDQIQNMNEKHIGGHDTNADKGHYYNEDAAAANFKNFRSLKEADLLALCPKVKPKKGDEVVAKKMTLDPQMPEKNKSPLAVNCLGCHNRESGQSYKVDDADSLKKFKAKAIDYVQKNYMPMGNPLKEEDKTALLKYLKNLQE